jgi:hypothetical protein
MKGLVYSAIVFSFLALTLWAQKPVAMIYVSRSEAAKAKQMTQLSRDQDREKTAFADHAATALPRG